MAFDPSNMTPIGMNLWAHTFQTIPEGLVILNFVFRTCPKRAAL